MPLKAGTLDKKPAAGGYSESMAEAIGHAFRKEWSHAMEGAELPATTSPDLQLLFVAVAQGVVGYLRKHADSFDVGVTVSGAHTARHSASTTVEIKTTGTLYTT